MLLGDLIARFSDEAMAREALLATGDLATLAAVNVRAEESGLGVGAYMAAAVRRYAAEATDEEWVTLLGAMGSAQDPGTVFLRRAFAYVGSAKCLASDCPPVIDERRA